MLANLRWFWCRHFHQALHQFNYNLAGFLSFSGHRGPEDLDMIILWYCPRCNRGWSQSDLRPRRRNA